MADEDFGQLLGTLLASLAHARRIVDEETVAIAEYYKDNPLLEGMSLPRVRVPEMVLDLPMLIRDYRGGEKETPQDRKVIRSKVVEELKNVAAREEVELPENLLKRFDIEMENKLKVLSISPALRSATKETVMQGVEKAFLESMQSERIQLSPTKIKTITASIRKQAGEIAVLKPGSPPLIKVSILTAEVKDQGSEATVTRIRLVMREEGMEWGVYEKPDGTIKRKLIPE